MLTLVQRSANIEMWNIIPHERSAKKVTNTKDLRERIKAKGLKYKAIAEILGITPYCLQRKIENENEFKVSEVDKLSSMLGLTLQETQDIFFS